MRLRPKEYVDLFRQFVGYSNEVDVQPIPVAIWQDGRGISTREAAPFASFAVVTGNPTAGNHWIYTFTPVTASRLLRLRISWAEMGRETATAQIRLRVGAATAKDSTSAIVPFGDAVPLIGVIPTADQVTAANLPSGQYQLAAATDLPQFAYPEYSVEIAIPPSQVLEIFSTTVDDAFDFSVGYYTLPIV